MDLDAVKGWLIVLTPVGAALWGVYIYRRVRTDKTDLTVVGQWQRIVTEMRTERDRTVDEVRRERDSLIAEMKGDLARCEAGSIALSQRVSAQDIQIAKLQQDNLAQSGELAYLKRRIDKDPA